MLPVAFRQTDQRFVVMFCHLFCDLLQGRIARPQQRRIYFHDDHGVATVDGIDEPSNDVEFEAFDVDFITDGLKALSSWSPIEPST